MKASFSLRAISRLPSPKLMRCAPVALSLIACACSAGDKSASGSRVDQPGEGDGANLDSMGGSSSSPSNPDLGSGELLNDDQVTPNTMNCGLEYFSVERRPADVLLVLDRSGSMDETPDETTASATNPTKWDLTVPALTQIVTETNSGVAWGMKLFPEGQDNDECTPETINDVIHVPIAPGNASAVVGAIDATTPDGDGTPTGDAIRAAVSYFAGRQSNNRPYIVLATDGEPSCSPSGDGQENARPYAVAAVSDAAGQGIPVFVVGVATEKESATAALNEMAVAGGAARPDPNPLATRYYLANTQDELVAALRAITGEIASCVFPLSKPPPVPENIGVKIDGTTLLQHDSTRQDGWEYVDAAMTAVEVYGPWCDQIQTAAHDVQVIYACRGVTIE